MKKDNLRKVAEELIWYGGKSEDGRWQIFLCVDFDYTLTSKGSWTTGKFIESPHAFETLKRWEKEYNCKYILDTMRGGDNIDAAIKWCNENGLYFIGHNRNPYQEKEEYDSTNKTWCAYSIDDHNLGCPLIYPEGSGRPYVDWLGVAEEMEKILQPLSELLEEMADEVLETKRKVMGAFPDEQDNVNTKEGCHIVACMKNETKQITI